MCNGLTIHVISIQIACDKHLTRLSGPGCKQSSIIHCGLWKKCRERSSLAVTRNLLFEICSAVHNFWFGMKWSIRKSNSRFATTIFIGCITLVDTGGLGLNPLDCWDRGFESHWGHGYSSLVLCKQQPQRRAYHSFRKVLPWVNCNN